MSKNGFTLIELLVSISILAILSTIGVSVFRTVQINARDQQRLRNLNLIKQTLELYRNEKGTYPATEELSAKLIPTYVEALPADPKTNNPYLYKSLPIGSYVLCAIKEGSNNTGLVPAGCGDPATCDAGVPCGMGLSSD